MVEKRVVYELRHPNWWDCPEAEYVPDPRDRWPNELTGALRCPGHRLEAEERRVKGDRLLAKEQRILVLRKAQL